MSEEDETMRSAFSNFGFLLLWIGAGIFALFATLIAFVVLLLGASLLLMLIAQNQPEAMTSSFGIIYSFIIYGLMGLVFGLIFGGVQKSLLRQKTNEPWRGWLIASAIGGVAAIILTLIILAGQLAPYLQWQILPPEEALVWIILQATTIPFGILALAQSFVLAQHVHGAWAWVLANLVGGLVLFGLIAAGAFSWATSALLMVVLTIALSAVPALVTGFAMLWLLNLNWRHHYPEY